MAALFGPQADTWFRVAIAGLVGAPALLVAGLMLIARSPLATEEGEMYEQPIQFDHRHHVSDDGIDCRYCHDTVERGAFAGIPDTAKCLNCHSQIWNETDFLAPVRNSFFTGAPIPWQRVHRLPDYVYFNHSIHVHKGIGCVSCHGRVDLMPQVQRSAPLTMQWCLDCHRAPLPHLRPQSEITNLAWRPKEDPVELGQRLAREYDIHTRTSCTTCHR